MPALRVVCMADFDRLVVPIQRKESTTGAFAYLEFRYQEKKYRHKEIKHDALCSPKAGTQDNNE